MRLSDGERLQLRLPDGSQVPGDGAGDLDPVTGDLLVCRLPDGVCRVAQRDVIGVGPR